MNAPNITNLADIFTWVNDLTSGLFGLLSLLGIFIVAFMRLYYSGSENALLTSLFLTSVMGIFLTLLGVVNVNIVASLVLLTGAMALVKIL